MVPPLLFNVQMAPLSGGGGGGGGVGRRRVRLHQQVRLPLFLQNNQPLRVAGCRVTNRHCRHHDGQRRRTAWTYVAAARRDDDDDDGNVDDESMTVAYFVGWFAEGGKNQVQ